MVQGNVTIGKTTFNGHECSTTYEYVRCLPQCPWSLAGYGARYEVYPEGTCGDQRITIGNG